MDKQRYRAELNPSKTGSYFRDEKGKYWEGRKCPQCSHLRGVVHSRASGQLSRRASQKHITVVALNSEDRVVDYIKRFGITINKDFKVGSPENLELLHQSGHHGPDLVYRESVSKREITVEVKTAVNLKSKGRPTNCWYVSQVSPLRRNDSLVAIVFPTCIVFDIMGSHLEACNKWGKRTVTSLYRRENMTQEVTLKKGDMLMIKIDSRLNEEQVQVQSVDFPDGNQEGVLYFRRATKKIAKVSLSSALAHIKTGNWKMLEKNG